MLAVLAWRRQPDVLAQSALRGVLTAEPDFLGYRYIPPGANAAAAALPHDDRMLLAVGTSVVLVDPATGESSRHVQSSVRLPGGSECAAGQRGRERMPC